MKKILTKGLTQAEQLDTYYSKLSEISEILSKAETEIYYRVSELIRGKEIDREDILMSTHKKFVREYLKSNNNDNNKYLVDFFNILRDTICSTYNPSSWYFIRRYNNKPYYVDKKMNKKIR
jgi:hypothetical protein